MGTPVSELSPELIKELKCGYYVNAPECIEEIFHRYQGYERYVRKAYFKDGKAVKLSETISQKITKTTSSGKTWSRWVRTVHIIGVKKSGVTYIKTRNQKGMWITRNYAESAGFPFSNFTVAIEGKKPHIDSRSLPGEFIEAFEWSDDPAVISKALFGVHRKDLVRGVATNMKNRNEYKIFFAWLLRRRDVPRDWIANLLLLDGIFGRKLLFSIKRKLYRRFRHIINSLDLSSIRNLYRDTTEERLDVIEDCFRMLRAVDPKNHITKVKNWTDLHDQLVIVFNAEAHVPLKEVDLIKSLDRRIKRATGNEKAVLIEEKRRLVKRKKEQEEMNLKLESVGFIPARSSSDLIKWGIIMSHCIGSYGSSLQRGNVYFAALDGNKIVGNGEIVGGKLRQFRGFANGPVPNNDSYMRKLMEIGVENVDILF